MIFTYVFSCTIRIICRLENQFIQPYIVCTIISAKYEFKKNYPITSHRNIRYTCRKELSKRLAGTIRDDATFHRPISLS